MESTSESNHKRQRKGFVKNKENEVVNTGEESQWKERYLQAIQLKNEADTDLESLFTLKKESEGALLSRIQLLEEKIADLEAELSHKRTIASTNPDNSSRTTIEFYETMTGMTVRCENGIFKCKVSNKLKRSFAKFQMTTDEEMTYEPRANAKIFPEYMHCGLAFDKDLAPSLMADVLASLFVEDSSNDDA